MKKNVLLTLVLLFCFAAMLFGYRFVSETADNQTQETEASKASQTPSPLETNMALSGSSSSKPLSVSFTNKFGTSTTICAHVGCDNYIASSGDTNCCSSHSNRCAECNSYVDEDALYCMECIEDAVNTIIDDSSEFSSQYKTDPEYKKNVDDVAGAYGVSSEEVDRKIQAVTNAMNK